MRLSKLSGGLELITFKGIQKTTLIDFPGKVACTLFLPKCNFRCPFCYNKQLVFDNDTGIKINEKQALDFLKERKGFLDGVCITGGEPTLNKDLPSFLEKTKALGLLSKLDTNGAIPEMLKILLEKKLLDYISMDIKSSKKGYEKAAGIKVDLQKIEESIALIRNSGIEYEFRSTLVPALHSKQDVLEIGQWLNGSKRFFLQQFNPNVNLLDSKLQGTSPFSAEKMQNFAKSLKPFFAKVGVRGI